MNKFKEFIDWIKNAFIGKKETKPLDKPFYVKELTKTSISRGVNGDLSRMVNVFNTDKPYPFIRMGTGWESMLILLGYDGFNAVPEDTEESQDINEVKNLSNLIMRKRWLKKK